MAGVDAALAQTLFRSLEQFHLQDAAVDGDLGDRITGVPAARLPPDALTMPVEVQQLARRHPQRLQPFAQPQPIQYLDGMRQQVDSDSQGAQGGRGLVQVHFMPLFGELQGGNASTDACADDADFH